MKTSVHDDLYFYWVSLDGTEEVHDQIRGAGSYSKNKKNVYDYILGLGRNCKPAREDIGIAMTINSLNHHTVSDLVDGMG